MKLERAFKLVICPSDSHCTFIYSFTVAIPHAGRGYSVEVLAGAIAGATAATVLLYTAVLGVVMVIRQRKKK